MCETHDFHNFCGHIDTRTKKQSYGLHMISCGMHGSDIYLHSGKNCHFSTCITYFHTRLGPTFPTFDTFSDNYPYSPTRTRWSKTPCYLELEVHLCHLHCSNMYTRCFAIRLSPNCATLQVKNAGIDKGDADMSITVSPAEINKIYFHPHKSKEP